MPTYLSILKIEWGIRSLTICRYSCKDNEPKTSKHMKKYTDRMIIEMVRRIVAKFNPEKIILFGSYARGTASSESDVDLLIVMRITESKRMTQLGIRRALHDIAIPLDVIVSDPSEFEWRKDVVGTIEWPAVHEGRVLYAKS